MESSGRADFKTVPGFAFRATFEGDIKGFRPLKVLFATTALYLFGSELCLTVLHFDLICLAGSMVWIFSMFMLNMFDNTTIILSGM